MNYEQAVELAVSRLTPITDCAKLDAQLLLCHACSINQTTLIAHPKHDLNQRQQKLFNAILHRRTEGEPLAYITGEKEFWSLDFKVNKHVLIPRPETELLVELSLESITNKKFPRVLELGTGSGAIAISIARDREDCTIIATDISREALKVATKNAKHHEVNIKFIQSDWFDNITSEKFDLIVSNPPYVSKDDPKLCQFVSLYEPTQALISKKAGLFALEHIINHAKNFLTPTGTLILEHGFQQAVQVQSIFDCMQYKNIATHKDIANLPRATLAHI